MERKRQKLVRDDGLSMFDALLLDGVSRRGSQRAFAEENGINPGTFSRWLRGVINPLNLRGNKKNEPKLEESLGFKIEYLRRLGDVSVREACEIVLDHIDRSARHPSGSWHS